MHHLLDCLPFAALNDHLAQDQHEEGGSRAEAGLARASGRQLAGSANFHFVRSDQISPSTTYVTERPVEGADESKTGIWGFEPSPDLASFGRLWCRVREADFANQVVVDGIEFGQELDDGTFRSSVTVEEASGLQHELPLTQRYILQQWDIHGVRLRGYQSRWWPLDAIVDVSFTRVFVYDLDPMGGPPHPVSMGQESEASIIAHTLATTMTPEGKVFWREALAAGALDPDEEQQRDDDADGLPDLATPFWDAVRDLREKHDTALGMRFFMGNFFPLEGEPNPQVEVPATTTIRISPTRVIVVLSLALCREKADFEPGGLIGVARFYPNLMVKGSADLKALKFAVRIRRPEKTTGDGCQCHEMHNEIGAGLWADANEDVHQGMGRRISGFDLPSLPHWSHLFSYYVANVDDPKHGVIGERLHVIKASEKGKRTASGHVLRFPVPPLAGILGLTVPDDDTLKNKRFLTEEIEGHPALWMTSKLARQGEFDNIHIAPRMFLEADYVDDSETLLVRDDLAPLASKLGTESVVMAPFCAHDCLHFHWRWSDEGSRSWTLGWNDTHPYSAAGSPMVAQNQDVFVRMLSRHAFTYAAEIREPIFRGMPQFLCHHGAGYGVNAKAYKASWVFLTVAAKTFDSVGGPPAFGKDVSIVGVPIPMRISSEDSWALFYWRLRYMAFRTKVGWTLFERVTFYDLDAARRL